MYASVSTTEPSCSLQVIQRSLLSSFRAVVVYASFYAAAPGCFGVMRAFIVIVPGCFGLLFCYKMGFRVFNYFSSVVVKHAFSSFI